MEIKNITVTEISGVVTVCSEKGRTDRMDNRKSYGLSLCVDGQITYIQNGKEYILAEWDTNNELMPSQVSHGSGKKISWVCATCGHHWSAVLYSRKNNKGCPKCGIERRGKRKSKIEPPNP